MRPVRVGIYVRVSTQEQSCELQTRELTDHVKARGWQLHHIYEDKATGTNGNRPQLKLLLADARERKIDLVICWKLDRFFRSLKDLVTVLQELSELGVGFVSLRDSVDLTTATGRLMLHMIGAFAEFEANLIRERVRAGLMHAKQKGKQLGRPKRRDDAKILNLRREGWSVREIAKQTNSSIGSVQRALSSTKSLQAID